MTFFRFSEGTSHEAIVLKSSVRLSPCLTLLLFDKDQPTMP